MEIEIQRETLLKPLQSIIGVVERRQTLPILANVLLVVKGGQLSITGTDLEVELQARINLNQANLEQPSQAQSLDQSDAITVPGRKFMDICKSLPDQSKIQISHEKERVIIRSGRSRFTLSTLAASDFPTIQETSGAAEFTLEQKNLRYLTQRTHFAMAQQDVRYYLNGMLLEVHKGIIRAVATDGHRLALNSVPAPVVDNAFVQVILPRKGVIELMRLLEDVESEISAQISSNHLRIIGLDFTFTSKLIDGRFPDYDKVLPKNGNKIIVVDRELLKQALTRVSILSNEKFRGVRLQLRSGLLRILANNPDQEEAEEEISVDYKQDNLEIGFNVSYLIDILNTISSPSVKMTFSDPNSSILVEEYGSESHSLFVVMPMRL